MNWRLFVTLALLALPYFVLSQKDVALRKRKAINQRLRNGGKLKEGQIVNALDVAYPLKFFESENEYDWSKPARFSEELRGMSVKGEYLE